MNFRYKVKGRAERFFILNDTIFYAGKKIELCITEQDFNHIKEHCTFTEIVDFQSQLNASDSILNNSI